MPAGTFAMGRCEGGGCSDDFMEGRADETPEHDVTVSAFALDAFEVTVGRFRNFIAAYGGPPASGAGAHPRIASSGWQSTWNSELAIDADSLRNNLACHGDFAAWTDTPGENEGKPINCVSWYEAFAFCAWDGGRLPTEAEWEHAAAGGSDNRRYAWGNDPPNPTLAAFGCLGQSPSTCTSDDLRPVGSFSAGVGRWGHHDLAGNVFELVLDAWETDWYASGGLSCTDCANLAPLPYRGARGGGWTSPVANLRAAFRTNPETGGRNIVIGFRCASDMP